MSVLFRSDGWVKTSQGPAVPGAQIFVCTQPANAPASLVPVAPSPQASVFSDNGGLVPITQPIITDGFGHYDFYAAAGIYTVLVYLNGTLQQQYPDQSVGGIGSGGGTGLTAGSGVTIVGSTISAQTVELQVNGVNAGSQTKFNVVSGSSMTIVDDGSGDVTFSANSQLPANGILGDTLIVETSGFVADKLLPDFRAIKYSAFAATYALLGYGAGSVTGTVSSTLSDNGPTATEIGQQTLGTGTLSALIAGYSENVIGTTLGILRRSSFRMCLNTTNNIRGWVGLLQGSSTSITLGTTYSSDTPTAVSYAAFRFSAGVDTVWQATTSDGSSQTVISTGVAPTTGSTQLFEITYDGIHVNFYINRTLVAQSSAHLPSTSQILCMCSRVDNKNSGVAVSQNLAYMYTQEAP